MEYLSIIADVMKYCIEKYGLWETVIAFAALISIPIVLYKLDAIILAVKV